MQAYPIEEQQQVHQLPGGQSESMMIFSSPKTVKEVNLLKLDYVINAFQNWATSLHHAMGKKE